MCQTLTEYQTLGQEAAPLQIGKPRLQKEGSGVRQDLACASAFQGKPRIHQLFMAVLEIQGKVSKRSPVDRVSRTVPESRTAGFSQALRCQGALQGVGGDASNSDF